MSKSEAFDTKGVRFTHSFADARVVIFASEWHRDIIDLLVEDAKTTLREHGVEHVAVIDVPGSYELPQAASFYLRHPNAEYHGHLEQFGQHAGDIDLRQVNGSSINGAICFGCVVQGDTPHFTFICNAVANQLEALACQTNIPIMFGVLTTNTVAQAQARADGTHSRKGQEVAVALLKMLDMKWSIPQELASLYSPDGK